MRRKAFKQWPDTKATFQALKLCFRSISETTENPRVGLRKPLIPAALAEAQGQLWRGAA